MQYGFLLSSSDDILKPYETLSWKYSYSYKGSSTHKHWISKAYGNENSKEKTIKIYEKERSFSKSLNCLL